jgi:hypothetical protein
MYRFKYKKGIPLPYDRQGYVYFVSKNYRFLPPKRRQRIDRLIEEIGRSYADALRAFVIRGETSSAIESEYYCSSSQLYRLVREYYLRFPVE